MGGGNPPTSLSDSILSTISVSLTLLLSVRRPPSPVPHSQIRHYSYRQTEDMVEIKRQVTEDLSASHHEDSDGGKYRLLYTKSKVYVNPTAYSRDNIPGFVAIVKRVCHLPQPGGLDRGVVYSLFLCMCRRQQTPPICSHGFPKVCWMRKDRASGKSS